jgi:ribosomal protein L37E
MFCPKCGKRQFSDDIRFCAKCGLPLEAARKSLTTGSAVIEQRRSKSLSPKTKGILQGIAIIPAGIGVMAVIDIFYEALGAGMMAGLYSTLTMVVLAAIARILYAILMEQGAAPATGITAQPLPLELAPAATDAVSSAALSAVTGETVHSVTEHTTRQLQPNR